MTTTPNTAGSATGIDLAKMSRDEVIKIMIKRDMLSQHGYRTLLNGDFISLNLDHLTALANAALARATPQHSVTEQAAAWANWKVGTDSYVPFKTRDEAEASVRRSDIAATQEGPYEAVPLFHRQSARAQPLASTAATQPEQASALTLPGCLADRLYEAIGFARDRASRAGSVVRMKKWDDTAADLRAALAIPASTAPTQQENEQGGTGCDKCDEGWVYKPCPYCTIPASTAASERQAGADNLETLDRRLGAIRKFGDAKLTNDVETGQIPIHKALEQIDAARALSGRATIPSEADEREKFEGWLHGTGLHATYSDAQAVLSHRATMSKCRECNGTGMADSGGVHPWGEPALIPCGCRATTATAGYKLVPLVPTKEMYDAARLTWCVTPSFDVEAIYKAMLAATPDIATTAADQQGEQNSSSNISSTLGVTADQQGVAQPPQSDPRSDPKSPQSEGAAQAQAGDVARLNFMVQHEAWVAFGKDGESCRVFSRNEDGDAVPMLGWGARHWRHDPREAIDAAIAAMAAPATGSKA